MTRPAKWLWWRTVELIFRAQFRLSGDLVPSVPIEVDVFTGGQILNYNFRDQCKKGNVTPMKGSIKEFSKNGVTLADGSFVECDIVIYGTGFEKSYDYLAKDLQAK